MWIGFGCDDFDVFERDTYEGWEWEKKGSRKRKWDFLRESFKDPVALESEESLSHTHNLRTCVGSSASWERITILVAWIRPSGLQYLGRGGEGEAEELSTEGSARNRTLVSCSKNTPTMRSKPSYFPPTSIAFVLKHFYHTLATIIRTWNFALFDFVYIWLWDSKYLRFHRKSVKN